MKKQCTIDAILQFCTMEMWKTAAPPMENRYSRSDGKAADFPTARKHRFPQLRKHGRLRTFPQRLLLRISFLSGPDRKRKEDKKRSGSVTLGSNRRRRSRSAMEKCSKLLLCAPQTGGAGPHGYLLPSVLKSVRFGGFAPLYRRPASHEGKNMGGFICAAHRRKNRGFPTRFYTVLRAPGRA